MKKIFYLMLVAVMAITMSACNWSNNTECQIPAEDTVTYMQWQSVDSITSHINLNDSSCITMMVEDSIVVFETQGIESFKIVADTTELPVTKDSNIYYVSLIDIESIPAVQEDSVAVRRIILNPSIQGSEETLNVPVVFKDFQ